MNFNTSAYGFFLLAVFAAYWALRERRNHRLGLLLVVSWFFYACWNAWYLALIVASSAFDYWVGGQMAVPEREQASRRRLLVWSVVANLSLLGVFKYYGFFRDNVDALLGSIGIGLPALDVLLPVGISFYTFQSMSYTIDLYRREIEPAKSFREFALYVAFFPQLVAGPIVRARDFLPQLANHPCLTQVQLQQGLYRIMVGLGKKVLIADPLAVCLVDPVFTTGAEVGGIYALLAVYAYALQIYCDFSGYSDIAIGSARLLGFWIPENFNAPYQARSVREFWQRWHISLSSWLRDYLYIPLGGNRGSPKRVARTLMTTMLLGGLWHGAAWHFVVWGGLHGAALIVQRWWQQRGVPLVRGRHRAKVELLLTFHFVCLAWVFFRAPDLATGVDVLGRIFTGGAGLRLPLLAWLALLVGFLTHALSTDTKERLRARFTDAPISIAGALIALLFGLLAWAQVGGAPFIYFQF